MSSNNTTLVLTGGGMRCTWTGGLLYGLHEQGIMPKNIVASSGSSGSAVYFALGQIESIRRIFTEHLPGNRFISLKRISRIIDIDFLIDDVFKLREPINWNAVKESPIQIICPIREAGGRRIRIVTNKDMDYEVLRASKALPVLYGKDIQIGDLFYRDYAFSPVELAQYAPKSSRIIVVDVRTKNPFLRTLGKPFMKPVTDKTGLPPHTSVIIPKIHGHILSSDKYTLTQMFEDGRRYALENRNLFRV